MSHYSIAKLKLKNVNVNLLKKTIEELARELNGEIVSEISDYYGNKRTDFIVGIRTPEMYRGVGIRVNDNGELEIIGDFFGHNYEREVQKFQNLLVQNYTANAVKTALAQLNYNVQMKKQATNIVVEGWRW